MSLSSAQAKLAHSMKELNVLWSHVRPSWRDEVARSFENEVITELEHRVRSATGAMEQMQDVLQRVRRDCA